MDEPLMSVIDGQRYYLHSNRLYSVAAATDSTGAVVERYSYDAYGQRHVEAPDGSPRTSTSIGNEWGFTGRRVDEETGLNFFRTRYQDPKLGRFLNRMPWWGMHGQKLMPYWTGLMPQSWQERFSDHLATANGAYVEGRENLYDFMMQTPSNGVEPFSDFTNSPQGQAQDFRETQKHLPVHTVYVPPGTPVMVASEPTIQVQGFNPQTLLPYTVTTTRTALDDYFNSSMKAGFTAGSLFMPVPGGAFASLLGRGGLEVGGLGYASLARASMSLPCKAAPIYPNLAVRMEYNMQVALMSNVLRDVQAAGTSLEDTAYIMSQLRAQIRQGARDMMEDQAAAASLPPIRDVEFFVQKYSQQGYKGDDLWNKIIQESMKPNQGVNDSVGASIKLSPPVGAAP